MKKQFISPLLIILSMLLLIISRLISDSEIDWFIYAPIGIIIMAIIGIVSEYRKLK